MIQPLRVPRRQGGGRRDMGGRSQWNGRMVGAAGIEVGAAIAVPSFAFVINWSARARNGYVLSAAADFVLGLAAFDLVALVYANVFAEVMRNETFHENFNRIEVFFFCATTIAWLVLFLPLEHRMSEGYDFAARRYLHGRPMGSFLLGWAVLATFFATHIFAYLYE